MGHESLNRSLFVDFKNDFFVLCNPDNYEGTKCFNAVVTYVQ
jgi:hypothetical protein